MGYIEKPRKEGRGGREGEGTQQKVEESNTWQALQ